MENQPERKAIVVVEDNKAIAELITTALNEEPDYYAVAVHDGALALDVIRSVKASLILLDVMIPGITGMQLYDMLKADPSTADTPILFLTAAKIDHEFERRGIEDYLAKPFDLDDLLQRVEKICRQPGT